MTYVLVTTEKRGVFFGKVVDRDDDKKTITLTEARNCIYWSEDVRGFLGLAANGPTAGCRIGPAASKLELNGVTSISECSDKAVAAWEAEPWK